jgi:hypothetical protein
MKKAIISFLLIVSIIFTTQYTQVEAANPIKVFVNGNQLSFTNNPYVDRQSNSTLVEFRPIFESLGMKVGWDQKTQTITGTKKNLNIKLKLGSKQATVNGQKKELAVAPKIENKRTLVPLRFVGESSNNLVNWNNDTQTIQIASTELSYDSEIYEFTNFNSITGNGYSEHLSELERPFMLNGSIFMTIKLKYTALNLLLD